MMGKASRLVYLKSASVWRELGIFHNPTADHQGTGRSAAYLLRRQSARMQSQCSKVPKGIGRLASLACICNQYIATTGSWPMGNIRALDCATTADWSTRNAPWSPKSLKRTGEYMQLLLIHAGCCWWLALVSAWAPGRVDSRMSDSKVREIKELEGNQTVMMMLNAREV